MPIVPSYGGPQVGASSLPGARVAAPQTPDVRGTQMGQAAQALDQVAKATAAIEQHANQLVARDVDTQATQDFDALLNAPGGVLSRKGRDAVLSIGDARAAATKLHDEKLSSVTNPAVRELVAPMLAVRLNHTLDAINRHSAAEGFNYDNQTSVSRATVSLQDAAGDYTNEDRFKLALGVAKFEANNLGQLNGWDEATTRLQAAKFQDTGFKLRYEAWRMQDPVGAFQNFQQNAERISPLVRQQIGADLFHAAAPMIAGALNQAGGVGAPGQVSNDPTLPRGIRNNNPGNVVKGSDTWEGEVQGSDPRYVTFATPEAGIRAMGKTLLTYQDKHGLNTVEGIISRWAPATENNTPAYIASVSKALGVPPDAPIDLHDSGTMNRITRAIIQVENGPAANKITDQQIALGLSAATGSAALPPASSAPAGTPGGARSGVAMFDALPDDWKLHVIQLARAQASQDMAAARESLRGRVQDATAAYLATGFAPNAPNGAEFVRAFGQAEGVSRYRAFQDVATLGQNLQQVKTLPAASLANLLESSKPTPGDGFAEKQRNFELLSHAIEQVQSARAADPVAYALQSKSYGIQPIQQWGDQKAVEQELSRRAAAVVQMGNDYGTPPTLLTKGEASTISAALKAAPVETQKTVLASIYRGVGELGLFKQTMQAIAPDAPTVAVAGIYQARGTRTTEGRDVADLILRGQAILTPDSKADGSGHTGGRALLKMPEEKLLMSDWNSVTGDAFKGREQAADLFMQTAKAIYAAKSAEAGDYSGVIDSGRWKSAISLATGGIESYNGAKIVMPYGMGFDKFQNLMQTRTDQIARSGDVPNASPRELMRLPLENIGDGRYLFRRGAGYLVSKDGRPVVVDLSRGR